MANPEMQVATHSLQMGGEGFREGSAARDVIVLPAALPRPHGALHGDRGIWKHIGLFEAVEHAIDHRAALGSIDGAVRLVAILSCERGERRDKAQRGKCQIQAHEESPEGVYW